MEERKNNKNTDLFEGVQISTGVVKGADNNAGSIISRGNTMVQTRTQYHTAIAVQKPRDLDKVVVNVLKEARYAGEDWYYSWNVGGKTPKHVEGGSIGLAMALAREWTNCEIDVEYCRQGDQDVFTARFIDFEKGCTFTRVYKQKSKPPIGRYNVDRWEDMEFQKAQSKAIRNVVLSGIPRWLQKVAIENAKKEVLSNIERAGIAQARQSAVNFLTGYGVSQEQLEDYLKKRKEDWTADDVATLRGIASQIRDGQVSPDEAFSKQNKNGTTREEKKEKTITSKEFMDLVERAKTQLGPNKIKEILYTNFGVADPKKVNKDQRTKIVETINDLVGVS